MASSQVPQRSQVSFLPALSNRGGTGKSHLNETHPGTRERFRAGQWRPLEVRPPQGEVAVDRQATGDPPAGNSRPSAPGEQLERWVALTQMRTAQAPVPESQVLVSPVLTSGWPQIPEPASPFFPASGPSPSPPPPSAQLASARPEPRQAHHPPPNFPRFPARSSLTCCGAQVPASVMQSWLRSLARPRPAGPALPQPPPLAREPEPVTLLAGRVARGFRQLQIQTRAGGAGSAQLRAGEATKGAEKRRRWAVGEEIWEGRGDDQDKQEIPSSPPGLQRGLERSSGYWLGGDTQ